jgi:hypothetical protein
MRITKWAVTISLSLILAVASACHFSFTTAHISELRLGKDKGVSQPASSFAANDKIYAVAEISNAPSAVKVKGRMLVDAVEGQKSGPIPGIETTVDLSGSGSATFTFTPPAAGWPKGKYKVEVFMLDSGGEQKDQKTADLSVS